MRTLLLVIAEVFPPRPGGSGRWLWELYRRLPRGSLWVLAGQAPDALPFDQQQPFPVRRLALRFPNWGLRSALRYVAAIRQARASLRESRAQIVHCGKAIPEGLIGWALGRLTGRPFWVYVHGEELTLARGSRELTWLTRLVFRGAQQLVANSGHTRDILVSDWATSPAKVWVMPPGVDTDRFVPAARSEAVRAMLGWSARKVILTVGALQKRKGQDMMIRALPALLDDFPDLLYVMAGEGWERGYLERLASDLGVSGHVQFRGVADEAELVSCYQQCDLFALPNRQVGWDFEGFGMVLLEAQACARPVIAGASGGTAEALDAPRTGLLVACESPDPLSVAVRGLLLDQALATRMGAAGREWVVAHRSWDVLAERAQALFLGPPTRADRGV